MAHLCAGTNMDDRYSEVAIIRQGYLHLTRLLESVFSPRKKWKLTGRWPPTAGNWLAALA